MAKKVIKNAPGSGEDLVTSFIKSSKHPLRAEMQMLREIISGADKKITEHIKWNAPSFCIDGDDRITLNLHKTDCILIVFHRGAKAKAMRTPGTLFEDTSGLLEWVAPDRATIKFDNMDTILQNKARLTRLVKQWMAITRA